MDTELPNVDPQDAEAQGGGNSDTEVRDWYLGLRTRTLDLVGDYAGNERFLLEGDSLLLHCFSDTRIDVEGKLISINNEDLCIPPHKYALKPLYLLARSVIVRHLNCNLPKTHPKIEIHGFSSLNDPDFGQYLESSGIYFVMCHDGALTAIESEKLHSVVGTVDLDWQKIALRKMIRQFISFGFNVALVNGLEVRDTKVMAMIVQARRSDALPLGNPNLLAKSGILAREAPEKRLSKMHLDEQSDAILKFLRTLPPTCSQKTSSVSTDLFTERLSLVAFTIEDILSKRPEQTPLASALLLHAVLLIHVPLSDRRIRMVKLADADGLRAHRAFLEDFAVTARAAIDDIHWRQHFDNADGHCDVADLLDGRLFKMVLSTVQGQPDAATLLPREVIRDFDSIASFVELQSGVQLQILEKHHLTGQVLIASPERNFAHSVLPFSNPVFDHHLASIKIDIDVSNAAVVDGRTARIFREITHWHNKRSLDSIKGTKPIRNDKAGQRYLRSNQRYMDEMMKYAASLTNAAGKLLDPQTITVRKETKGSSASTYTNNKNSDASQNAKKGGKGKPAVSKAKELAQASINAKKNTDAEKTIASWANMRITFDKVPDAEARYRRVMIYLEDLTADKAKILEADIILYSLQPLLEIWAGFCRANRRREGYRVAALIWSQIRRLSKAPAGLTTEILSESGEVCRILNIPFTSETPVTGNHRGLTFTFRIPEVSSQTLSVALPPHDFQLLHCGPYMDRNMDSKPDARVPFNPDGWQRTVLDELDAQHSVFVVAPTSAGKTFISFYAMEQVLRADDNGVLVYVAPTKALVNQIAAEVQARFSKRYEHGGKSVWAIHTREYRVNNPTGCQILVTVPHILQIMLLSPSNAKSWAPRVKRIIFDEIHSIGQAEDGVIWEQLLLLAPCPIIALSATVGNPGQFNDWLTSTQRSSGCEMSMIKHEHRYSDLRKFLYNPPRTFAFGGLGKRSTLGAVGLDEVPGFQFFHPVASLINKTRGMPADLALEARDCLSLWKVMVRHQTTDYPVPEDLDPKISCPPTIQKRNIIDWEKKLKKLLVSWMPDPKSPFDKVLHEFSTPLEVAVSEELQVSPSTNKAISGDEIDSHDLCQTALPLITSLYEQNALPAIFFNFDRTACERIARAILDGLQKSEILWKKESPKWKSMMEGYEKWKAACMIKTPRAVKSKKSGDKDAERTSKADSERDSAEREGSRYESFDPEAPCEEFSFADTTKVLDSEMEDYVKQLEWKGITGWLISALKRGLGVHHAGMNRKYRQIIEILFRKGYLRVAIATGTLALGINMPCKTVVFSGDSVFLTALNFRQCAGRAGRRGFDILGNVIFHGIPYEKACRLLSSRLPDLNGHFPITTTLVLRLFSLLYDSKNSTYAQRAINSLLSQPRLYLGGESFKDQVLHHVRFSIEYLRRQQLLGSSGEPLNFTSCVSHLYFTENSAFAFHTLLKGGYFHDLCSGINAKPQMTLRQLILVMAHLFGRRPCRNSDVEFIEKIVKKSSSIVFLPELPRKATEILQRHNQETLETFITYVKSFAKQHVTGEDRTLPLTGLQVGGSNHGTVNTLNSLPPTAARSHFVALSGHSDTFTSISDLCSSTRSGIFLEKAVIPQIDIPSPVPLNAYLYDFFMHGAVKPLEIANGIGKGDVWFLLNDFSLVLATVVTSLENFLKVTPTDETDMINLSGQGDVMDEDAGEEEESNPLSEQSLKTVTAKAPEPVLKAGKKKVVKDAWDASDSDDETDITSPEETASTARTAESLLGSDDHSSSGGSSSDDGLMNVLTAFRLLKTEFDEKFKAMWA